MDITPRTVAINVTGEITGQQFTGLLKVRPIMTHAEQLATAALARELLGPRPNEATPRAFNQAHLLAECQMRLAEAPAWWKDNRNGLDLFDDAVLREVYNLVTKVEEDFKKELQEQAKAAKAEIAKVDTAAVKQ